jgi:hypothetical protein
MISGIIGRKVEHGTMNFSPFGGNYPHGPHQYDPTQQQPLPFSSDDRVSNDIGRNPAFMRGGCGFQYGPFYGIPPTMQRADQGKLIKHDFTIDTHCKGHTAF